MTDKELAEGFIKINKAAMKAISEGSFEEAISIFREGMVLEERLGLTVQASESLANIGNVFLSAGEYDEALVYFQKAKESFTNTANTDGIVSMDLSIANILELEDDEADAERQLTAALRVSRTGEQRGKVYYRIACLQLRTGNHYSAQESFTRALAEMERLNRREDMLLCLLTRASLFHQMNNEVSASRDIARAKSIAYGSRRLMGIFEDAVSDLELDS